MSKKFVWHHADHGIPLDVRAWIEDRVYEAGWMGVSIENNGYSSRIDDLRATRAQTKFLSLEPLLGQLNSLDLKGIDWVIVGGESGPGARPMTLDWARAIRRQCARAGTAFFLKQLGGVRNKRGGDNALLDGRLWREYPDAEPRYDGRFAPGV